MTQYDAAAAPMFASFTTTADLRPYTLQEETVDLTAVNAKREKKKRLLFGM